MKVLQKGNSKGWKIEQTCTGLGHGYGCEARLLVSANDIFVSTSLRTNATTEYNYTFKCPECGMCTNIPKESIPESVKNNAMAKYKKEEGKTDTRAIYKKVKGNS